MNYFCNTTTVLYLYRFIILLFFVGFLKNYVVRTIKNVDLISLKINNKWTNMKIL